MSASKNSRRKAPSITSAERFLLLLAERGSAEFSPGADAYSVPGHRGALRRKDADEFEAQDLVIRDEAGRLLLTAAGRAWAKRRMAAQNPYRAQHGDLQGSGPEGPQIELAESPLLWLYRRRDSTGQRLIGDAMFAAGERLRADFTSGQMTPRVTVNWSAVGKGSRVPGAPEPGAGALAARQRLRKALDEVGPELAGILLDVCCFLKRLEDVERDRRWPARSAKVILGLALARLARHYGYSDCAEGRELRKAG